MLDNQILKLYYVHFILKWNDRYILKIIDVPYVAKCKLGK